LLKPAADHVLGLPDGKKRLADVVAALKRSFNLCGTHEPALKLREEIAFFAAVRAYLVKASNVELTLRREDRDAALRRILDGALMADQVVDVFEAAGLEKPNLSILDDQFLADLQGMEQRNLAVEMLQKLLEDEIKSRATSSLVQSRKFSELLRLALSRYEKRTITTAQLMEELLAMARSYRAAIQKGESLGLTREESAFYDALADNEAAARELSDDILRTIARELLEQIRRNAGVDWQKRDSVRAQLRLMVKRILRKHRYPPEADGSYDKAIQLVLDQAETFADEWSK
jgi:type I restriction enzyme, R subunit